jgi:hypothetical protein
MEGVGRNKNREKNLNDFLFVSAHVDPVWRHDELPVSLGDLELLRGVIDLALKDEVRDVIGVVWPELSPE